MTNPALCPSVQQSAKRSSLNIALIAHLKYPIAQPFIGGLEMHTHLLARKLTSRGHHVTLFASRHSDLPSVVDLCEPTSRIAAAQVDLTEELAYLGIVQRIASGAFDIVHNNSLHPLPLRSAHRLPPMITVLHTPPFTPLADSVKNAASRFVAVSRSVARDWHGYVSVDDVVANGIELDAFAPLGERADPPSAIWYGRIVPEKGLHLAIEAARLAGLPLAIAGPIIDEQYFRNAIYPHLGVTTQYLGHLDHKALRCEIAKAWVALMTPRWEEPFGLVAAEALATGTPVATFRRGALPDVIGAAGALAEPDDPADLARAARHALEIDRALCRRHAVEQLDCERMIDAYLAIYLSMLAAKPSLSVAAE